MSPSLPSLHDVQQYQEIIDCAAGGIIVCKNIRSIDKKTLDLLRSYDWPGNIRELQNVIERSVILGAGDVFSIDELWLSRESSPPVAGVQFASTSKRQPQSEREIIETALTESRGRVSGPSGRQPSSEFPHPRLLTGSRP